MSRADDLRRLISMLNSERYGVDGWNRAGLDSMGDEQELFLQFRGLVNTREAKPASDEFLGLQDRVLGEIIREKGITSAKDLPRVPKDPRISLWRGDITTLAADAIVNAANSQMLGCWVPGHFCIDNAIHTFAGVQLRLECARLMSKQGFPEPTGMAKMTPAYNLPSKWIIHTVGPIANGAPSDVDRALLGDCYRACLDAALGSGAKSIAFCCISTGVFGFPQAEAAQIAVHTVRKWLDEGNSDMHAIFNVFSEDDERLYHELLFD